MVKKKRNVLKQIYKVNPQTNAYIIEVLLESYNEIFNGWDPSPIKRRDIEPELLQFIEQCAYEIPLKDDVEIWLYLPEDQYNKKKEHLTQLAIQNNFRFVIHFIKQELASIRTRIIVYLFMAFTFLTLGYLWRQQASQAVLMTSLTEGLVIGGWVFTWEAFSLFFFSSQKILGRLRRYNRFLVSEIQFIYKKE